MTNYKLLIVSILSVLTLIPAFMQAMATTANQITVTNETHKTLVLYFDSLIYKRPQVETILPTQTRTIWLGDYSDIDITKNITIEARLTTGESTTWSFAQTDLRPQMTLIFSKPAGRPLTLTIIRPNGSTRIVDPITLQEM